MSLIEMNSICKSYRNIDFETQVLKDITIHINEGDYVSIIGPSGSGKSTLMAIAGCLSQPTSGEYILDGEDVGELNDRKLSRIRNEKIGFVFQAFHLLPGLTALDNVTLPLVYSQKTPSNIKESAREVLAKVGLEHRLRHTPGQLSGGEQQRVTIARSLINNPPIILADEPTGNLDSKNGIEIAGIEYITDQKGEIYTYDVNTNTNYNSIAEKDSKLKGMISIAEFLKKELLLVSNINVVA